MIILHPNLVSLLAGPQSKSMYKNLEIRQYKSFFANIKNVMPLLFLFLPLYTLSLPLYTLSICLFIYLSFSLPLFLSLLFSLSFLLLYYCFLNIFCTVSGIFLRSNSSSNLSYNYFCIDISVIIPLLYLFSPLYSVCMILVFI